MEGSSLKNHRRLLRVLNIDPSYDETQSRTKIWLLESTAYKDCRDIRLANCCKWL